MEREDNIYHKINLNWYPGHMFKTKKQIIEDLCVIAMSESSETQNTPCMNAGLFWKSSIPPVDTKTLL